MTPDPPGEAPPRDPAGGPSPSTPRFRADTAPSEGPERPAPGPRRPEPDEASSAAPAAATTTSGALASPPEDRPPGPPAKTAAAPRGRRVRARKVHRVVRHIDPWSVLKVSVLFFAAVFLIICVASAILWNGARQAGTIDKVEDFITDTGGFGNCPTPEVVEPPVTSTTVAPAVTTPTTAPVVEEEDDDEDCPDGAELEGAFEFEDQKIFQAYFVGGIVLVLAGAAGAVVLAMLFNLMSDLTGGVRVTVLEEEPRPKGRTGSPGSEGRG